jgi:altronate dehydratase
LGNKEKHKSKKKHEKVLLKLHKLAENCKSECCEKYKKSEKKRCKSCPMFDLLKKITQTPSL